VVAFRTFLVMLWLVLVGYTAVVVSSHGWGLLGVFFGDMFAMGWPGQFNLDFMMMLMLSSLWVAWRHRFSGLGVFLGVVALFGGALFLTTYLLAISLIARGDIHEMLMGTSRASGS
jgi:hypothetical protein